MCFSASASFASSAVLAVIGIAAWRAAPLPAEKPFAAIPLCFAVQQAVEGWLWLALQHASMADSRGPATAAYVLFSHVFWPLFIPLAVLLLEPPGRRRALLRVLVTAGGATAAWLAAETLLHGVTARLERGHIEYVLPNVHAVGATLLYVTATCAGLLASSHRTVRLFGWSTLLAFGASWLFLETWLVSMWCFFAAWLSVLVLHQARRPSGRREALQPLRSS